MTMEASDPFATGAPADEADPFAEVEGAAPDMPTPDDGEPPIVDREGREVGPSQAGQRMAAQAARNGAREAAEPTPDEAEPQEPQEPAAEAQEPADAPVGRRGPQGTPAAPQEAAEGPDDGPELRRYKLLYATGPGQWAEAPLQADSPHAERDEHGELWLKARNADHARRLAWVVFDRPEEGVQCVPVAASSWKPRIVRARAPQPERERLEIV